jgi:hypothetical protein
MPAISKLDTSLRQSLKNTKLPVVRIYKEPRSIGGHGNDAVRAMGMLIARREKKFFGHFSKFGPRHLQFVAKLLVRTDIAGGPHLVRVCCAARPSAEGKN